MQARIRDVYERAVANMPPVAEKKYWRRYVYLWIYYAVYEELHAKDVTRARAVYKEVLKLVPHKLFTFAKLWTLAAQFEVCLDHSHQFEPIAFVHRSGTTFSQADALRLA
jgi:hypothetical protein